MPNKPRKAKKWLHPRAIEREYTADVVSIADETYALVRELVVPTFDSASVRQDAIEDIPEAAGWFETLRQGFLAVAARIRAVPIETRVAQFASAINRFNSNQFHAVIRSAYAVDIFKQEPWLVNVLRNWESQNIALIKSVPAQSLDRLHGKIVQAVRTGQTQRDLVKIVQSEYGVAKRRAELIANDQVGKLNGQLTQERQVGIGVKQYRWRGVLDSRERDSHIAREGLIFSWDKPPPDGNPGEPIRCFPGSTVFDLSNGCNKLWRRAFNGPITTIVTGDSATLKATPNHPILTRRGWVPINKLQKGDDIIKSVFDSGFVGESNVNEFCPSIEQVFDFMSSFDLLTTSAGTEFDFHGDGSKRNVDVVNTNGFMSSDFVAVLFERADQVGFARAFQDADFSIFNSLGSAKSAFFRLLLATYSRVRGLGEAGSLFGAHPGHSNEVGFSPAPAWDLVVTKYSGNDATGNPVFLRQIQNAIPNRVVGANLGLWQVGDRVVCRVTFSDGRINPPSAQEFAEIVGMTPKAQAYFFDGQSGLYETMGVVEKSVSIFNGHVYNMETDCGWYKADSIVSHNCRCGAEAVLPLFEDLEGLQFPDLTPRRAQGLFPQLPGAAQL